MRNVVVKSILALTIAVASITVVSAQCGTEYIWPADKAKAEESLVLLKDNRANNPAHAVAPLKWLITNAPNLNKSLYIYGAEVYQNLAKAEKNPARQAVYVDSLMIMHDLRIQHTECGEKASVINRKALAAYPYMLNTDKVKDLIKYMDEAFQLNGNDIMDGTLVPYFQTVYMLRAKYKAFTDDEVIDRYDNLTEIVDQKIKKAQSEGKNPGKYKEYQETLDKIFDGMEIKFDCAKVKAKLEPRYRANPKDIDLAKKIFYHMLKGKCTDDPLWMETAEAVFEPNPDFGIAKNLAIKYLSQENYAKAEEWSKKALAIAPTASDKAETLILLAKIEAKTGSKSSARDYCRQALSADPSAKEAYELIGDLYMNSGSDCAKGNSYAEDRLVFIAAFDMYAKAGEQKKMAQARSQFPSNAEIFELGWKEGDVKKIDGCWVGESVTIKTRGKE